MIYKYYLYIFAIKYIKLIYMRLFLIDKPVCRNAIEVARSAKIIYQMEREFYPYLTVEFLPRKYSTKNSNNKNETIVLLTKDQAIEKSYDFSDPKTVEELRKLIWKHLKEDYQITELIGKDGLPDPTVGEKDKVIQGWTSKLKSLEKDMCCKIITDAITKSYTDYLIQHEVYKLDTHDIQTNKTCKANRLQECGNNYPPNTDLFRRCVSEVNWLCDNGYDKNNRNKTVDNKNKEVMKARNDIYKYLEKSGLRVDKKEFDKIMFAGLFDDIGNRMGNKSMNTEDAVNDIMSEKNYFAIITPKTIENFGYNYSNKSLLILLILIILIIIYYTKK